LQSLRVVHQDSEPVDLSTPYIPGFLAFREVPPFQALLARAPAPRPQVLLVDGFGVLHPRRCGAASHLGVETGIPTIGVGKSLLAVDGLQEWLVVQELRAALAAECGDDVRASLDQLSLAGAGVPGPDTPERTSGAGGLATSTVEMSPDPSTMLLPALSRNGSTSVFAAAAGARPFNWQVVSDGHAPSSAPHPGVPAAVDESTAAAIAASGTLAADSGPVFEPSIGGNAPLGRMPSQSGVAGNSNSGSQPESGFARSIGGPEAFMPVGDETDEDTGTLRAAGGGVGAASSSSWSKRYYCRPGRDSAPVVCLDLVSEVDSARLGVAVAGLAGTRKPVYVSVGARPPACCA
jgi:Endonuclease V